MNNQIPAKGMDQECVTLCQAINRIPGIFTIESCCGHGKHEFLIWFKVVSNEHLPILLYFCDPCHVGFRWWCRVKTDCGMSPVTFCLESQTKGEAAYAQAEAIAKEINEFMDGNPDGLR